jgi:hypothetical protein
VRECAGIPLVSEENERVGTESSFKREREEVLFCERNKERKKRKIKREILIFTIYLNKAVSYLPCQHSTTTCIFNNQIHTPKPNWFTSS